MNALTAHRKARQKPLRTAVVAQAPERFGKSSWSLDHCAKARPRHKVQPLREDHGDGSKGAIKIRDKDKDTR
jgi:hypothetical protein